VLFLAPGGAAMALVADGASAPDPPVDTVNPFIPEDVDLTTCVGLLERPGCGSEARGGIRQTLVAIAMVGGLLIIFGRIAWAIRANHRRAAGPAPTVE